ncbi:MAG: hypothetical protein JWO02_3593 [Solirubrobacterales bacterium]|nr:hypothetical protein [Solirubrobacterales bacterium]
MSAEQDQPVCARLAALAETELALVQSGAVDELDAVHATRMQLLAELDVRGTGGLGAQDEAVLRAAARTQLLTREAMRQRRDDLAAELSRSGHARRAAAGYRASAER